MTDDTPEERLGFWLGNKFNEVEQRLDRIEADLAEIKARLAHASPGYDMRSDGEALPKLSDEWSSQALKDLEESMAGEQEEGR